MKTLVLLFVIILATGFTSCYTGRPVAKQIPDNNQTYNVDYLFEHDGCKVYRFYDKGNYVYFTNCTGRVTAISNDSAKVRIENSVRNISENNLK